MWRFKRAERLWCACSQPYSFYHAFIKRYWAGGPSEQNGAPIHRLCTLARKMGAESFLVEDALDQADVVQEIEYLFEADQNGGKIRRETRRTSPDSRVRATTITFLRVKKPARSRNLRFDSDDIIGQVTIITFPVPIKPGKLKSYIFEAIFRLPSMGPKNEQLLNNYVPISRRLRIDVDGKSHRIPASYYCQQNNVTSVCGHCSVRTILRTQLGRRISTKRLDELREELGFPGNLDTNAIVAVLDKYGLNVIVYDYGSNPPDIGNSNRPKPAGTNSKSVRKPRFPFPGDPVASVAPPEIVWGTLALLADSASASLLVIETHNDLNHVIPVLGHTFNSDEWHPVGTEIHVHGEGSASSSSLWIDHVVVHDDMLGPYYCLSRGGLFPGANLKLVDGSHLTPVVENAFNIEPDAVKLSDRRTGFIADELDSVSPLHWRPEPQVKPAQVLAILPSGVTASPIEVEDFARQLLDPVIKIIDGSGIAEGRWWHFFRKCYERRIFRTTLIARNTYLRQLARRADKDDPQQQHALVTLKARLPEQLWLAEVTLPNLLLANRAKLGELLIDPKAAANPADPDPEQLLAYLYGFRMPSILGVNRGKGKEFTSIKWGDSSHSPILAPLRHKTHW